MVGSSVAEEMFLWPVPFALRPFRQDSLKRLNLFLHAFKQRD